MLGRACMLLLLPAAARGQEVEHVRQITNGTGLYCRGCAVLVEAVHEQLMATRHRSMVNAPALTVPQLGPYASSGRAWRLWAARYSQEEAGPLSTAIASGARAYRRHSRRCDRL